MNKSENHWQGNKSGNQGQGIKPFENPYNFVPAPPRDTSAAEFGDHKPTGHHRYHAGLWSGKINVKLTTVTPLLIPDQGTTKNGHKIFGIRKNVNGEPYLPPTGIKGVLRAAFEAVTNSRMGVLDKHDNRLALRMSPRDAINFVPCRIVMGANGKFAVEFLTGELKIEENRSPKLPMYAAWIRRYDKRSKAKDRGESTTALSYSDGTIPKHGDRVFVQYNKEDHIKKNDIKDFCYLKVTHIRKVQDGEETPAGWSVGWVYVSGPNIGNKHDEKVFLDTQKKEPVELRDEVIRGWKTLISNYQNIHDKDIEKRKPARPQDYLGYNPGETAFSRHVYVKEDADLKAGTLCYAKVSKNGYSWKVDALYPVAISRDLYNVAPSDLFSSSLKPAAVVDELSPADRVFGWIKERGHGQFKGQLRVGTPVCMQKNTAIQKLSEDGIPLSNLGAPKPAQARFYAAQKQNGDPYDGNVSSKKKMYAQNQGIRGRKFYVHQKQSVVKGFWETGQANSLTHIAEKLGDRLICREWIRADGQKDDQNRSITEWIKPDTNFTFSIEVNNISPGEAGALIWLLCLPEGHHFRMGGGKPLGFGSVRLEIESIDLRDGEACRLDYENFGERTTGGGRISTPDSVSLLVDAYKQAFLLVCLPPEKQDFEGHRIIRSFLNAAKGGNLPVHYPRTSDELQSNGKSFEWFVANEKGNKFALPALWEDDRGLKGS